MALPKQNPRAANSTRARSRHKQPASAVPSNHHVVRARQKFLRAFPGGFTDETYLDWERDYKWRAHLRWQEDLSEATFRRLIGRRQFEAVARLASSIESRTNLLFSFEKMALRDALGSRTGAQTFSTALFDFLHGPEPANIRFASWVAALDRLPRRQTRVLTWPLATVFGFIAQPRTHFFFKPTVTREALRRCGTPLEYSSRPNWPLYKDLLDAVGQIRREIARMRPRDMIDMQSFLWVQGSDEYPG